MSAIYTTYNTLPSGEEPFMDDDDYAYTYTDDDPADDPSFYEFIDDEADLPF